MFKTTVCNLISYYSNFELSALQIFSRFLANPFSLNVLITCINVFEISIKFCILKTLYHSLQKQILVIFAHFAAFEYKCAKKAFSYLFLPIYSILPQITTEIPKKYIPPIPPMQYNTVQYSIITYKIAEDISNHFLFLLYTCSRRIFP